MKWLTSDVGRCRAGVGFFSDPTPKKASLGQLRCRVCRVCRAFLQAHVRKGSIRLYRGIQASQGKKTLHGLHTLHPHCSGRPSSGVGSGNAPYTDPTPPYMVAP